MVREDVGDIFGGVSDEELAALAKAKQPHAFPELLNRFYQLMLYKVANVRARGSSFGVDMDDLMQEASLGLHGAVVTFSPDEGASFRTYAGVCIDNRLRSAMRKSAREKNKPLTHYIELSDLCEGEDALDKADAGADPEAQVLIGESVSELRAHMRALLSDNEYNTFTQYLSGCSYEDIAKSLGTNTKAVDNALQRVRRKLRDSLPKET